MRLRKGHKANFEILQDAVRAGRVALVDCRDRKTNKSVAVVCALNHRQGELEMVPIARLFEGNPYDELDPPDPAGGYIAPERCV